MADADGMAFGRRVAFHRKKLGYSQRAFAARIGRSETWLSQVERGVRTIDRMSVLERLAEALDVPLVELAPRRGVIAGSQEVPRAATMLSLALASGDALRAVLAEARPVDPAELEARVARACDHASAARYDELAELLVELLPELEQAERHAGTAAGHAGTGAGHAGTGAGHAGTGAGHAGTGAGHAGTGAGHAGDERRRVSVAKARAYQAAAAALSELGEPAGAWVAVDRAIRAAREAGDPLLMAQGALRLAMVFQAARRFGLATRAAASAAEAIGGLVAQGDPAAVAMHGALHLQLAVAAAQSHDTDGAYDHLDIARRAGERLGEERDDYHIEFGPATVLLYEVAVAVELGDAGRALRVAGDIDLAWLSPERQAGLLIDVACAHAQVRHPEAVVTTLGEALRIAPEQVRNHGRVHVLVADLLRADRRSASGVPELAAQLKIENLTSYDTPGHHPH